MAKMVQKVSTLVVYVDHDDQFAHGNWDDVVANPVAELPKVLSPRKVRQLNTEPGEKLPVFYTDLKKGKVQQGCSSVENSEVDSGEERGGDEVDSGEESGADEDFFVDNDYEIEGEDDDHFEDNVDMDVNGRTKDNKKAKGSRLKTFQTSRLAVVVDEYDTDDETLELPDSYQEVEGKGKFKSWREEDMSNPSFFVGQVFPDVKKLRQAIIEYSAKNRVKNQAS